MKQFIKSVLVVFFFGSLAAQNNTTYWQQKVDYKMEIDMDVSNWQYKGKQLLTYTNNSPDVLNRVFYHLYFNAFQPGSEMDVRSRTVADPDPRVGDRISKLTPSEMGYIKLISLRQDGVILNYDVVGTVLEVTLAKSIQPGESTVFNMEWDAQVPVQIRRSGHDNAEGIALSMTQWYPKLAEYDFQGWHADPYIYREFYGVWGDFDVKISIDKNYTIGGSGNLQGKPKKKRGKKTWHFVAPSVHDFTWAADNEYIHDTYPGPNGVVLNFYYKNDPDIIDNWKKLQPITAELMKFYNENIGAYPYKQYSVIQGGDGGMEYAMCTLITGGRKLESLMGVTAHELAHTWFQFLLATHEGKHAWMDEGFAEYIGELAIDEVTKKKRANPFRGQYRGYRFLATSGQEASQGTHADRFATNQASSLSAYHKGGVFMAQLGYVIGEENLRKTIKQYFEEWSFKHPTPNDFIRVAEKVSNLELDWYLMDWTQTTNIIDYGITNVIEADGTTTVSLDRIGLMPMPIDLLVTYEDGSEELFYIPLQMMRGEKENSDPNIKRTILKDWAWAYPSYSFEIPESKKVEKLMIDPSQLMADINLKNNIWPLE
jgi:Peptidase family M1 domain